MLHSSPGEVELVRIERLGVKGVLAKAGATHLDVT